MNITITKTTHPGTLPPSDRLGFGTVVTDQCSPTICSSWTTAPIRAGTMRAS